MSTGLQRLPLVLLVLVCLAGGVWLGLQQQAPDDEADPYGHLGGDFTLSSVDGPVSLSDFRGKVVPIYFGFTFCPDICPTTLSSLASAMNQLTPAELAQVEGLFISVDPERDTLPNTAEYAAHFHPQIRGITGSPEQIAQVARQYLVIYEKVQMEDSAMDYSVDHSSLLYVVGKDGKIRSLVRHGDSPADIAAALRTAMAS